MRWWTRSSQTEEIGLERSSAVYVSNIARREEGKNDVPFNTFIINTTKKWPWRGRDEFTKQGSGKRCLQAGSLKSIRERKSSGVVGSRQKSHHIFVSL